MALIRKSEMLRQYKKNNSYTLDSLSEKSASEKLEASCEAFSEEKRYNIFLSHSYKDARVVENIRNMLSIGGNSVYVDWVEDDHLDRGKVTKNTATILKTRMDNCDSLIYLTSNNAEGSVWMPWELGYMDAKTGRVAVAPILDEGEDENEFTGRVHPNKGTERTTEQVLSGLFVKG